VTSGIIPVYRDEGLLDPMQVSQQLGISRQMQLDVGQYELEDRVMAPRISSLLS